MRDSAQCTHSYTMYDRDTKIKEAFSDRGDLLLLVVSYVQFVQSLIL